MFRINLSCCNITHVVYKYIYSYPISSTLLQLVLGTIDAQAYL